MQTLKDRLLAIEVNNLPIYQTPTWRALLHYGKGLRSKIQSNSTFFLSHNGYKDLKAEYIATINALLADYQNLQDSAICNYPARAYFIAKTLGDMEFSKHVDNSQCVELQEFLAVVPIDVVFLEFAAESDIYPGSSMGHIFLHFEGVAQEDIIKQIDKQHRLEIKKGSKQEYSFSYFANLSRVFNPLDYVFAISGSLNGAYMLKPYKNIEYEYLHNEVRSIYRFKLKMRDIRLFRLHLWEIRNKLIDYAFITHNCTNATQELIEVLDTRLISSRIKPFVTPVEYLRELNAKDAISLEDVLVPEGKEKFVAHYGHNQILHARKSSSIRIELDNAEQASIYFAPIYSDLRNADSAYREFIESRLGSVELKVSRVGSDAVHIAKIELIHLHSIMDFIRTRNFSKLLSLRLEPNLYNHLGKKLKSNVRIYDGMPNSQTRLFPTLELGAGIGAYIGSGAIYLMPRVGYRYELVHNPYISASGGIIAQIWRVRVWGEYSVYYDIVANNRGYDSIARAYIGLNVYKSVDIFIEANWHWNMFVNPKIIYEYKKHTSTTIGLSVQF